MMHTDATAPSTPHELSGTHSPLLGTVVEIRITAHDRADAERAEKVICDEISRLEQLFSVYAETSMLNRWIADPTTTRSNEFDELMSIALRWQRGSKGAFNVSTRRLWNLWAKAAGDGCRPSAGELHQLADDIAEPPYRFDGHVLHRVGDCTGVDLNAIAKGYIVDLAADAAWRLCDLVSLTVGVGGDVTHRGPVAVEVVIDDPATLLDDGPPLLTVALQNSAVATSGSSRRGMSVDGEWVSHLLDPRTGQPVYGSASVAVVAPDAATADVVATIVSVMELGEGLDFVDSLNAKDHRIGHPTQSLSGLTPSSIECWIIDRNGCVHHTGP